MESKGQAIPTRLGSHVGGSSVEDPPSPGPEHGRARLERMGCGSAHSPRSPPAVPLGRVHTRDAPGGHRQPSLHPERLSEHSEEGTPLPNTKGEASGLMATRVRVRGPQSSPVPRRVSVRAPAPESPGASLKSVKSRQLPATGPPSRAPDVKSGGSGPRSRVGGLPPQGTSSSV